MTNCPFELSSSLNSSASVSSLSEMKESILPFDQTASQTHHHPIVLLKDKASRKSLKIKRCVFIIIVIGIPIGLIVLLKHLLCPKGLIDIPFKPNYLFTLRDENQYALIELRNRIQMALVSNSQSAIAMMSISINYGTSNDPDAFKGLSHLVLKSKLNMVIGEYVKKHNAGIKHFNLTYRIDEETSQITYEIDKNFFWESVADVVASLTSKEEMKDSLLDDSLEGLNRKFEGFKNNDSFRLIQAINAIIYPKENFIGNYETLKKNDTLLLSLKEQLGIAFKRYYIGNNMKIVIETEDSINVIKEKVLKIFKDIPYSDSKGTLKTMGSSSLMLSNNMNTLNSSNLGKVIWIQSHLYLRNLKLIFIIPTSTNEAHVYYEYMTHLLNEKSKYSLFQKGTQINSIFDFSSRITRVLSTHIQLELNYCLADTGLYSLEEIITNTYSHLAALASLPFDKKRFSEFIRIKTTQILFKEETMQKRADRLMLYLKHGRSFDDYIEFTEASYLAHRNNRYLTPDNSLIVLESDKVDFLKYKIFTKNYLANKVIEPHFDFTYYVMDLSKETIELIKSTKCEEDIFKWTPNEFITKWNETISFDERTHATEKSEMEPEKIVETNHTVIWHRLDRSFRIPKVIVKVNIISPFLRSTDPNEYFLNTLFFNILRKQIEIKLSHAIEAGNTIEMKHNDNGFTFTIIAYSDVLWRMLDVIVKEFQRPQSNYDAFTETRNEYYYFQYQNLHQLSRSYFRRIIKYNHPKVELVPLGSESLGEIFEQIANNSIFTALIYGFIQKSDIVKKFKEYSALFDYGHPFRVNSMRYDTPSQAMSVIHSHEEFIGSYIIYLFNSDLYETDQSLNNYYQIGLKSDSLMAEAAILLAILSDISRNFLLLGNKRAIEIFIVDNIVYYDFNVEHLSISPDLLDKHLDIILDVLYSQLCGMRDEEFEAYKNKVMFDLRLTYNSLSHKADLVWNEIYRNTFKFHRTTISSFFLNYTKANLIQFMLKVFINKDSLRKLSIQLYKASSTSPYVCVDRVPYRLNSNIQSEVTTNLDILRKANEIVT